MTELTLPFLYDDRKKGIVYRGIVPLEVGQIFNGYNEDGDGPYKLQVVRKWFDDVWVYAYLLRPI